MFRVASDIECASLVYFKMSFAIQRSLLIATIAVCEGANSAFLQFQSYALATLDVDGCSLCTCDTHAIEYKRGLVCTII